MTSKPQTDGTSEQRRITMRSVKSTNTKPELFVRKQLFSMGYRYRLHGTSLPGKPDITFPGRRKVIFVNGCFWHGHACKRGARIPVMNRLYWQQKVQNNRERDKLHAKKLALIGWSVLTVWECELKPAEKLARRMEQFLEVKPSLSSERK